MHDILEDIDRWLLAGQRVALATVIRTAGSTPRPLGSRMAISEEGAMAGSVSGGCIEGAVFEEAQEVLRGGVPKRLDYGISDEVAWSVGLSCGGTLEVFIERIEPTERTERTKRADALPEGNTEESPADTPHSGTVPSAAQ